MSSASASALQSRHDDGAASDSEIDTPIDSQVEEDDEEESSSA
jgi:hypothetical protein